MQNKIDELTGKLLEEGVNKGKKEAERLIEEAKKHAADIISDARKAAKQIHEDAVKQMNDLKKSTASEIKLSSEQALSSLKQSIANTITAKIIDSNVQQTLSDPAVIKTLLTDLISNWKSGDGADLEILLPAGKKEELDANLREALQKELSAGFTITYDGSLKAGFQVGQKEGGYKISISDEDFSTFIKSYIRPKTKELLFT
jgi:V/A-type H+-transporting ATPase subunit E